MGQFIGHEPCPACGSSDGLARYAAGDATCFVCKHWEPADGAERPSASQRNRVTDWTPLKGHYAALTARGLSEETCKKCDYQLGETDSGKRVHIQLIKDDTGRLIDQKTRDKDKQFTWVAGSKYKGIIGSWSWPASGKSVVITEGEIDRMSISQAFDNKWSTGSLPNGSDSVEKAILADYEKLCRFDNIILCFDNDEPGQKALQKACEMLPVGRVKIMALSRKDANEVLLEDGPAPLVRAFWDAKPWRPDGIREGIEFTRERLKQRKAVGLSMPWPKISQMWLGSRDGELTTICAGSGIGKTTIARDWAYNDRIEHGVKIGNIYLEEDNETSAKAYCALHAGVPLKQVMQDPDSVSDEAWDAALAAVIHNGMLFYDHFGSLESDRLMTMMRYMAASGCRRIVLDHISIVTSGLESGSEGERKDIDILMTKLASFVKETGVSVYAIVHLKRSNGKNFNEGGQISLNDMRGSASIEQLSFNVLAVERDQQDKGKKLFARLRSLKCRITGETGEADLLKWNVKTGRYEVASEVDLESFDPHDQAQDQTF
nr:DnaB-like helicase C-terminal domain-containing protein [Bradyrhizobium sp. BR 10289]